MALLLLTLVDTTVVDDGCANVEVGADDTVEFVEDAVDVAIDCAAPSEKTEGVIGFGF